ncbi:unnamed protein product [Rotaria socialis]|uniref:Uncharacterized protein n=1 Tax=Rotaria socialis TaxID=392032 RepID=A0A821UJL8_9BILA|nr:unnamed protein product [Rotaria socialis]CAF4891114.1 unnamed protein product [Rotaria socialis]
MSMYFTSFFIIINFVLSSNSNDLYPSYHLTVNPIKALEWSENSVLAYVTTVRLFDYDHHIFQYRRYPCQYFYTDEIQLFNSNESFSQCSYNTTANNYEYSFQLHLDSRHVEPYIFKNIAIQCTYIKRSLSLLNITNIYVGWNLKGRENNSDCSFDINTPHNILQTPYTISELITLQCKSLLACNHSKLNLEQFLSTYVQIVYGSSLDLQIPYCSLEKSLSHVIDTNCAQTNGFLQQLIALIKQNSVARREDEQVKIKDS